MKSKGTIFTLSYPGGVDINERNRSELLAFMNFRPPKYILVFCFFSLQLFASSQTYMVLNQWRLYKNEISIRGGVSNFLGDLGGRNQIGSDFIYDLETSLFKPAFTFDHRLYLSRAFVWRNSFAFQQIAGDDKLTTEQFRMNRNLHFKSNVWEYDMMMELQLMTDKDSRRFNLRNNRGKKIGWKYRAKGVYLFAGVGVFSYNPKAFYGGQWHTLRNMHTEGQGLPGGPEQYNPYGICIPLGGGFKYAIDHQWSFTLELNYRFTFTDYLDDVSGSYYDNAAIESQYGITAAVLANPTIHSIPYSQLGYDPTNTGYQRGDHTDKDGFMTFTMGVHYRLKNKYSRPGGSMKGRIKRYDRTVF